MAAVLISVKYHHSLLLRISRPSSSPSTLTTTVIITPTIRNGSIKCRNLSLVAPPPSAGGLSSAGLSDGLPPSPSTCSPAYRRPDWLLFNDFCIAPCASAEVLTLFGNQKVPCLLYYSRVSNPPLPPSSPLQYLTSAPLLAALTAYPPPNPHPTPPHTLPPPPPGDFVNPMAYCGSDQSVWSDDVMWRVSHVDIVVMQLGPLHIPCLLYNTLSQLSPLQDCSVNA